MRRPSWRGFLGSIYRWPAGIRGSRVGITGPTWIAASCALLLVLLLTGRPNAASPDTLYWFAPLPPMPERPGRPYVGSDDFMELFSPDAAWQEASRHIQVFKLYGEWVYAVATDQQLEQVVTDLRRRGIALAVEIGPLSTEGCGDGVEGFAQPQWAQIADRIQAVGGTIDYIEMDEPYYYAHVFDGAHACRWSAATVAKKLGEFIGDARKRFPNVVIGEVEPLTGRADAAEYQAWTEVFRAVNGFKLTFLHMDIDWRRRDWPREAKILERYARRRGISVGIIYDGNYGDRTDATWLINAGERAKRYERDAAGHPDHVLFQSWHDKPDHLLPETAAFTFTQFIDRYFAGRQRLGLAAVTSLAGQRE